MPATTKPTSTIGAAADAPRRPLSSGLGSSPVSGSGSASPPSLDDASSAYYEPSVTPRPATSAHRYATYTGEDDGDGEDGDDGDFDDDGNELLSSPPSSAASSYIDANQNNDDDAFYDAADLRHDASLPRQKFRRRAADYPAMMPPPLPPPLPQPLSPPLPPAPRARSHTVDVRHDHGDGDGDNDGDSGEGEQRSRIATLLTWLCPCLALRAFIKKFLRASATGEREPLLAQHRHVERTTVSAARHAHQPRQARAQPPTSVIKNASTDGNCAAAAAVAAAVASQQQQQSQQQQFQQQQQQQHLQLQRHQRAMARSSTIYDAIMYLQTMPLYGPLATAIYAHYAPGEPPNLALLPPDAFLAPSYAATLVAHLTASVLAAPTVSTVPLLLAISGPVLPLRGNPGAAKDNVPQLAALHSALARLAARDDATRHALANLFAEVTEKAPQVVSVTTILPVIALLNFPDEEVLRASSAALGNLAVLAENKTAIVSLDVMPRLLQLTRSANVEIQCNSTGCITNLVSDEAVKSELSSRELLERLLRLTQSPDVRVARNATGALLNLTHTRANRVCMVTVGALPLLIALLRHPDSEVLYYATTALSNLAVDAETRDALIELGSRSDAADNDGAEFMGGRDDDDDDDDNNDDDHENDDENGDTDVDGRDEKGRRRRRRQRGARRRLSITRQPASSSVVSTLFNTLVAYLSPPTMLRLQTQAALALRNLASSPTFQHILIEDTPDFALAALVSHTNSEYPPLLLAAIACLRNLSICEALTPRLASLGLLTPVLDNLVFLVLYDGRVQSPLVRQLLDADGMLLTRDIVDEIQVHTVSTLRNLAASSAENKQLILDRRVLDVFQVLTQRSRAALSGDNVLCELGATVAVLATDDACRSLMLAQNALMLVAKLCAPTYSVCVISNGVAALANLATRPTEPHLILELLHTHTVLHAVAAMISSPHWTLRHLGLHAIDVLLAIGDRSIADLVARACRDAILALSHTVASEVAQESAAAAAAAATAAAAAALAAAAAATVAPATDAATTSASTTPHPRSCATSPSPPAAPRLPSLPPQLLPSAEAISSPPTSSSSLLSSSVPSQPRYHDSEPPEAARYRSPVPRISSKQKRRNSSAAANARHDTKPEPHASTTLSSAPGIDDDKVSANDVTCSPTQNGSEGPETQIQVARKLLAKILPMIQ